MSSNDATGKLATEERRFLLRLARDSIRFGLRHHTPLVPETAKLPPALVTPRATFVTLKKNGALRGCVGSLEARFPLAVDVARNAYGAAFRDIRFRAIEESELEDLQIEISLLTAPEPISHGSEADLLRQLRPGLDGLILQEGSRRGTFLPSVWTSLPEPEEFIRQLKIKAGFPPDHWSEAMEAFRYRTERLTDEEEWK